ncbi:MAG: hypothetical protein PHP48_09040 [Bacteroidales bacterium]|jgi:hypothetical protein|nr:hypothetical protein [Bacteroidales bacterium]
MTKKVIFQLTAMLLLLAGCSTTSTDQPTINDYQIGEKWIWKWSRSVDGEVRAEGEDIQEVVDYNGVLGLWNGIDTVKVSTTLDQKQSSTPFRNWPLHVGKKWKYESEWENNEGTTGKTSQDVEIVSYEELNVEAGKFMAYKIEYKGIVTNSRGFKGKMSDTWWYSPDLKTYIKHINNDGYGIYINELTYYSKVQ